MIHGARLSTLEEVFRQFFTKSDLQLERILADYEAEGIHYGGVNIVLQDEEQV
jgi:hypothetical protein